MLHFMTEHHPLQARLPVMWLVCALIVLLSVGFVLPCMLDITTTPDSEFTTFSKGTWLFIAGAFWVFGAVAWLKAGRQQRVSFLHRSNPYPPGGFDPAEALLRHPAAQAATAAYGEPVSPLAGLAPRILGPDDDPDFLEELGRRIRDGLEDALFLRATYVRWT